MLANMRKENNIVRLVRMCAPSDSADVTQTITRCVPRVCMGQVTSNTDEGRGMMEALKSNEKVCLCICVFVCVCVCVFNVASHIDVLLREQMHSCCTGESPDPRPSMPVYQPYHIHCVQQCPSVQAHIRTCTQAHAGTLQNNYAPSSCRLLVNSCC